MIKVDQFEARVHFLTDACVKFAFVNKQKKEKKFSSSNLNELIQFEASSIRTFDRYKS